MAASGIHARSLGAALAVAVLALPALAGCSVSGGSGGSGSGKVHVVAGENFYGDLVSRVGGDLVSVTSVLSDPNVDPHTYESSTQNAEQVADATLVIENGLGYDAFLDHLLSASPRSDRKVIDVQQLLGLADGSNPHIWYDPQTMPRVARAVADELEAQRPDSRAIFETNLKTYLDSFAPLTAKIAQIKKDYPADPVIYTEPVPAYMLAALGLTDLTPTGFAKAIEDGSDPAPVDVAATQDLLTGHKVKALLYNNQATSPVTSSIESLATKSGVPVVGVSETMPAGADGYVGWQVAQLDALAMALGGGK